MLAVSEEATNQGVVMAVSMQVFPAAMQQGIREIVDVAKSDMKMEDPRWRELALQVNSEVLEDARDDSLA